MRHRPVSPPGSFSRPGGRPGGDAGGGLAARCGRWADRHPVLVLLPPLALLLLVVFGNRQIMTGDEPRYLLYAMSFIRHGTLLMSLPEWNRISLRAAHYTFDSLPAGAGNVVLLNGVYLPVILSPIAGLFSLAGLRAATLLAGLWGLWCLGRLLRRVAGPLSAPAALLVTAFSLPLLPYLHLFYMETFLFALVCWGWERLQRPAPAGFGSDLLTAAILVAIPVVHLRGSVVAALLFVSLLGRLWSRGPRGRIAPLLLFAALAGAAFVFANLAIYGSVTGPVNTARPPAPSDWFAVLSMQLFNVHHGLLAYGPVWVLGYAGLLCALRRAGPADPSRSLLRQALLLAAVAAVTGVGVNPGECWPARFWVLSMPMLALGLAFWMHRARGVLPFLLLACLLLPTAVNTRLFAAHPNMFLEDRQTSTTYDALFARFGHLDANVVLPVETGDGRDVALARDLALLAAAVALLAALSLRYRLAALPALLVLLAVTDAARVRPLDRSVLRVQAAPDRLEVVFPRPLRRPVLSFGDSGQAWFVPPVLGRFEVEAAGEAGPVSGSQPANQTVASPCGGMIRSLSVRGGGIDLAGESARRLRVLESRSLLPGWLTGRRCGGG